jgi:hypothetical protein
MRLSERPSNPAANVMRNEPIYELGAPQFAAFLSSHKFGHIVPENRISCLILLVFFIY